MNDRPTPDPSSTPGPIEQPRVLRRSRDDRVIAGVCSGLGRYLGLARAGAADRPRGRRAARRTTDRAMTRVLADLEG